MQYLPAIKRLTVRLNYCRMYSNGNFLILGDLKRCWFWVMVGWSMPTIKVVDVPTIFFEYMGVTFEWDDDKYAKVANARTISFEECASVFCNPNYVTIDDVRFEYHEERFITIGMSNQARLLVVAWTLRDDNIRLITAMKAEKSYEQRYNRGY